jgi:CBS domain-containing protein
VLDGSGVLIETLREICPQLALFNAVLVVFNLVPGLPLDGGHVLRAFVWAATGSEERGTRVASAAGVAFAALFIGLGVLVALTLAPIAGLWMAFIGWFMLRTARAISMQSFVRKHLSRIRLGDALRDRSTASRWNTVADIQDLIGRVRRPVFIVDGEDLLGWVTPEQVRSIAPKKRAFTQVSSILVPVAKLIGLSADRTLLDALSLMNESGARELAVFEDDRPIGALTRDELLRILREGVDGGGGEAETAS